jgi:ketosteroid isomerase-like protein
MTHPNEQIVRDGFAAFSAGDQETLRRVIAVDAVWHVPGRNPLAGSYKGIEEILGFFGKTVALTEGTFATDVHDVAGNDEHVFAAYTVSGQRGEKSLRDNAVLVSMCMTARSPRPGARPVTSTPPTSSGADRERHRSSGVDRLTGAPDLADGSQASTSRGTRRPRLAVPGQQRCSVLALAHRPPSDRPTIESPGSDWGLILRNGSCRHRGRLTKTN